VVKELSFTAQTLPKIIIFIFGAQKIPKIRIFIFGLRTLPETQASFIFDAQALSKTQFFIRRTNTPENEKTEILKPHETNPLAACLLACLPPCNTHVHLEC
jgi:hypothetical protein